jgi:NAD-dependent SIR2 family protein deacetylase
MEAPSVNQLGCAIKSAKNILVLVGAGISVNAGIPDFRSPDFGIYSKYNCDVEDMFHIESFRNDPVPLYRLVFELMVDDTTKKLKQFSPTRTHKFLGELKKFGNLLRVYTQNIDGLDCEPVGLKPNKDVIQCHGNVDKILCSLCGRAQSIIFEEWMSYVGEYLRNDSKIPDNLCCKKCNGYLKPGVVLFGESLPSNFFTNIQKDAQICDLVIIIGSSLSVFPFAAIPALLKDPDTPIFIISKNFLPDSSSRYTVIDMDCDLVSDQLSRYLGLSDS